MWGRFKNSPLLFLVFLKLCVETFGVFTVNDLSLICGITDKDIFISEFPPQCTAAAAYTSDMDVLHVTDQLKNTLPMMIIMDSVNYNKKDDLKKMLRDLKTDILYDFIALDLNKMLQVNPIMIPPNATQYVLEYINGIKPNSDGAVLGLVINKDLQLLKDKNIDFNLINRVSEFYVLNTVCLKGCPENNLDGKTGVVLELDAEKFISNITQMGLAAKQLIFNMELSIETIKIRMSNDEFICSNRKPNEPSPYCKYPLKCIYQRAKMRSTLNLLGVFANSLEYDDIDGECRCTLPNDPKPQFRCLKTIEMASKGTDPFAPCI